MRDFYPTPRQLSPQQRAAARPVIHPTVQLERALKRLFPKAVIAVETADYGNRTSVSAVRFGPRHGVTTYAELGPVDRTVAQHYGGKLLRALYPVGWASPE